MHKCLCGVNPTCITANVADIDDEVLGDVQAKVIPKLTDISADRLSHERELAACEKLLEAIRDLQMKGENQ